MRRRYRASCAAVTCIGAVAAVGGIASCVSNANGPAPGAPEASTPDVSQPDTSLPPQPTPEASTADVSQADTSPPVDAGPGVDAAEAGCAPQAVPAFTPPPYVHAQGQQFACDDTSTLAMAAACTGAASSYTGCASFVAEAGFGGGDAAYCQTCLFTPEGLDGGDAGYGPAITGTVTVPNLAGCIEMADPTDAGLACAMAVQAAWACAEAACKPSCPVTDDPSRDAFLACTQAAAAGVCSAYALAASACLAVEADGGGIQSVPWCLGADGGVEQFSNIARYFCAS